MDDHDRRDVVDALNRESRSAQERILSTLESFRTWLMHALYLVYLKAKDNLQPLWNWLRLAFA